MKANGVSSRGAAGTTRRSGAENAYTSAPGVRAELLGLARGGPTRVRFRYLPETRPRRSIHDDYVVKYSNNDQDVTQSADQGLPNETIKLEAYTNEGAQLWLRGPGPNVDTGVWFSPFVLYGFDGDGRAEVAIKASEVAAADGGDGDINGDGVTDDRTSTEEFPAHDHKDVEFLEVWDGETGKTRARAPWVDVTPWGDDGWRYNRNQMAPAYLGGAEEDPSILSYYVGSDMSPPPAPRIPIAAGRWASVLV